MDDTGPWADSAEVKVSTFALQFFFSVLMVFKNLEKNSLEILPDHYWRVNVLWRQALQLLQDQPEWVSLSIPWILATISCDFEYGGSVHSNPDRKFVVKFHSVTRPWTKQAPQTLFECVPYSYSSTNQQLSHRVPNLEENVPCPWTYRQMLRRLYKKSEE